MDLDLKLLIYLDRRHILTDLKKVCEDFLEKLTEKTICNFPPLRYLFQVDVMDLLDLFPVVGENLIKEPLKWQRYCNDILYACLRSLDNDMKLHVQPSQVAVNVRLKCFPNLLCNSELRKYQGIVSFRGLLVDISKPTSYVYHTVWSCAEDCEDNEVILHYIPKAPPKCHVCRSVLFENSGLRRCADQVVATFKLKNNLLPKKFTVIDDLIPKLRLGATFVINAIVLKKATAVWCLEETTSLPAPITSPIPSDIKKLFTECDSKPWIFIYCLASVIGVNVCPLNGFIHVKISLLMSLVSIKANMIYDSAIINCLAACFDTSYIGALMRKASLLATTNAFLGMSNCSTSTTLVAASGGACVMSLPLQTYSQKQIHSIVQAIETGEINHDPYKVKLKCAIWAHGSNFKKIVLYDIGNVFGTICRAEDSEYNDELADFILQQAIELPTITNAEKQTLKDLSTYIDLVAGINVSTSEDTAKILSSYFMVARRERPKSVTAKNMEALIATCAMSARLCQRSVTNVDDAIFAIWLQVCGMSEPRFASEECLKTPADIKHVQKVMEQFTDWLEAFTGCSIPK